MKKVTLIIAVLFMVGCNKSAKQTVETDNSSFKVELLFEVDGCKVYRFVDGGRSRYFTTCSGGTSWSESHGKNSTVESGITTTLTPKTPTP